MELKEAKSIFTQLKALMLNSDFLNAKGKRQLFDAIHTYESHIENSIPKKAIEELREKIYEDLDGNALSRAYQISIDGYFKELLEGKQHENTRNKRIARLSI